MHFDNEKSGQSLRCKEASLFELLLVLARAVAARLLHRLVLLLLLLLLLLLGALRIADLLDDRLMRHVDTTWTNRGARCCASESHSEARARA